MNYLIVESRLAHVRATLDGVLAAAPAEHWTRTPASGGWSVGEVLAHLIQVETAIETAARRTLAQPPHPLKSSWKPRALWPPIWLVPFRGIQRQSPIPMDAALVSAKPEMLAKFAGRRRTTLTFLRETMAQRNDLGLYNWKHPFFGPLTFPEWCRLLAYHETRHTKQIREIVSSFQS